MSSIHKVEYKANEYGRAEVLIDGIKIQCRRFSFEHDADSIPYAEVEIFTKSDIETLADVGLRVDISDINSAIQCLRLAYQLEPEFKQSLAEELCRILYQTNDRDSNEQKAVFIAEGLMNV
jgi:hypothetical protein